MGVDVDAIGYRVATVAHKFLILVEAIVEWKAS